MSKERKNVITAKIPEFSYIPNDWKISALNKVAWFQEGPGLRHWQFTTSGMKVINVTNLVGGIINLEKTERYIAFEEFEKTYKHFAIDAGDILMASSGATYCKASIIGEKDLPVMMNTSVIRFKPIKDVDYNYLWAYLSSFLLKRQIDFLITGGAQPNFGPAHLNQAVIPLPPIQEQKAIAQVLSKADAAIQTTEKLITQKELRKKWLMQQLLTGKKRLKGFAGELKEIHIRDIAKEVSIRNKSDKQLTVLSCTKYDGLVPSLEYFGRKIFADDVSTYKIVPKNHFAYATNHIEEGSIGYQGLLDEALISPMYTVFKTNGTVNDIFLFRLLKSHPLVYQYQNRMEGSIDRRGGLRWDAFSIIKIKLPSIEEQTAIAHVFQVADKEISLLKAKAEKLREQKKGLMQQLLTGRVRLKIK
ncbi:MAG: restriction endonuclease subunit S [Crocinitomicaceae bacterium]|nr:restriction endonuclease subunit S [Crocinitomicaceae bacterium]